MSDRSPTPSARPVQPDDRGQLPSTEVVEFIHFCHRRRGVGWPELYDEMCAVAARREFRGWDQDQLAERGLSFTLFDMPRLASWVRLVLASQAPAAEEGPRLAPRPLRATA